MTEMQYAGLFDLKDKVAVITGGELRTKECNYRESVPKSKQDQEASAFTRPQHFSMPAAAK